MCRRLLRASLLLCLFGFLRSGLHAQEQPANATQEAPPTPANTINSNVSLVVLDGVAIDKQGNLVADLRREDFHITEDKTPQVISNIALPGAATPVNSVTINSTTDLEKLAPEAPVNIILLDEFTTRFEDMAFARYSLKKWLESQTGKLSAPTMLIAVSLQRFLVLSDYTQDKSRIFSALDHHFAEYPWPAHESTFVAEQYATAMISLRRVAEATGGHIGHKNMIWIGRGFPPHNFNQAGEARRTAGQLLNSRVTLYTIDPAGLKVGASEYDPLSFSWSGGDPDFQALARASGGRTLYGRNDVDAEIGTAIRDGANLYTLSYYSTNANSDSTKFRRITVNVDRPGVVFITRPGYFPLSHAARLNPGDTVGPHMASELAAAESGQMVYDAVPFQVQAMPPDALVLKLHLQSSGVVWYVSDGTKPRYTKIIVLCTSLDAKGRPLKNATHVYTFQAPASAPANGPLKFPLNFDLKVDPDPLAVTARRVVRVEGSGHMGTADVALSPGASGQSLSWHEEPVVSTQ